MKLVPIELNGVRVLTTAQLAESYGSDNQTLVNNFNRNKDRYTEGKHFIALRDQAKRDFINQNQIDLGSKNAAVLYLWTEKGSWLHAKSLNSDRAWEAYEMLVDDYYSLKQPIDPFAALSPELRSIILVDSKVQKLEHRVEEIDSKVETQITLTQGEQRRIQKAVSAKVHELAEDKDSRSPLYQELYREIKDRWAVPSYRDLLRKDILTVLKYIDAWMPRRVEA